MFNVSKFFMLPVLAFILSVGAFAADGVLFLKDKENNLLIEEAILDVPAMGDGDIYLTFKGMTFATDNFFHYKKNGRTVFYIVFAEDDKNKDHDKQYIMRGTYTRGNNLALYYGDIFTNKGGCCGDSCEREDKLKASDVEKELSHCDDKFKYIGGFKFSAPVVQSVFN